MVNARPFYPWALLVDKCVSFLNCFWLISRINQARDDGEQEVFNVLHWIDATLSMIRFFVIV